MSLSPLPQIDIVLLGIGAITAKTSEDIDRIRLRAVPAVNRGCLVATMSRSPLAPIRTTQRAPRSCIPCSSRKVRCDKSVPCGTCIRRGHPEACNRELVIVRGEATTYRDSPQLPTYDELKSENERLRHEIGVIKAERIGARPNLSSLGKPDQDQIQALCWPRRKKRFDEDEDEVEKRLWDTLASNCPVAGPDTKNWSDIVLPSQSCSEQLINYDEKWNSWVHYALEYPRFRHECDNFMAAVVTGMPLEKFDASWMAVYFSVLTVCILTALDLRRQRLIFSILQAALLMMDDDAAEELTASERG